MLVRLNADEMCPLLLKIMYLDICLEFHYYRGGWAGEPRAKIMKNGQSIFSVLNKGGTKSQGGQLQYCPTGLIPSDVITIELDGEGMVSDHAS